MVLEKLMKSHGLSTFIYTMENILSKAMQKCMCVCVCFRILIKWKFHMNCCGVYSKHSVEPSSNRTLNWMNQILHICDWRTLSWLRCFESPAAHSIPRPLHIYGERTQNECFLTIIIELIQYLIALSVALHKIFYGRSCIPATSTTTNHKMHVHDVKPIQKTLSFV